jgi:spore photoproduct lyase
MWGNQNGILDDLMAFATKHPNIMLEFKTKSKNISYFLNNAIPKNVFCSWTLNPQTIIDHEEHFTASLADRLNAAKTLAQKGMRVAFHFHPIMFYTHWERDYADVADAIINQFLPDDVLFVSLGTLHFTKPIIRAIRKLPHATKVLQMPLCKTADNKFSYPDETKQRMYRHVYQSFSPWHDHVFFYLCMETKTMWESTLRKSFETNDEFEKQFIDIMRGKMGLSPSHILLSVSRGDSPQQG